VKFKTVQIKRVRAGEDKGVGRKAPISLLLYFISSRLGGASLGNPESRAPRKKWRRFLDKHPFSEKRYTFSKNFRPFSCEKNYTQLPTCPQSPLPLKGELGEFQSYFRKDTPASTKIFGDFVSF